MPDTLPAFAPKPSVKITFGNGQTAVINYGVALFLRRHPFCRAITAFVGVACAVVCVVGFIRPNYFGFSYYSGFIFAPWLIYVAVIAGPEFELTFPIEQATTERKEAQAAYERSNLPEDALRLDLTRLNEYYVINQTQARSSFRWAIFALLLGFSTIITGIWLFYFKAGAGDALMASLSTAAGIVVNLVSALFLYLHSKTQDRSVFYFEQLSRLQRVAIAIRLVTQHEDAQQRQRARDLVIRELIKSGSAGRPPRPR